MLWIAGHSVVEIGDGAVHVESEGGLHATSIAPRQQAVNQTNG